MPCMGYELRVAASTLIVVGEECIMDANLKSRSLGVKSENVEPC